MVRVAGKPTLEYIIDNLNLYGVKEIMVNLSYKPLQLMNYFGSRLIYAYENEPIGELNTIKRNWDWLKKDVVIACNGDTITDVNLYDMYWQHCRERAALTAFKEGEICAGTWMFSPSYPVNGRNGAKCLADLKSKPFYSEARWYDIGTPERLQIARKFYAKKATHVSCLS